MVAPSLSYEADVTLVARPAPATRALRLFTWDRGQGRGGGNLAGRMQALQFIKPDGDKIFIKGGSVAGHFHTIDPKKEIKVSDTLIVAAGYGTGVSLHAASGLPVLVAFNDANMARVGRLGSGAGRVAAKGERPSCLRTTPRPGPGTSST